jgi:sugar phosphate isomerase/epimerase
MKVKQCVAPNCPFGLGLRLSRCAAESLAEGNRRDDAKNFFDDHGLYVFTINGFPYGQFHGARVKENVYAPDWRSAERRDYTNLLADILADFLPDGLNGSISTVPVSFKPWIKNESDLKSAVSNLSVCAAHLADRNICLALEPEPGCFLETTEETLRFFDEQLPEAVCRSIGVCFDTCHAAVQFENVAGSLKRYVDAGVRVAKVQLSAAATIKPDELERFSDPIYLHQTKALKSDGSYQYWNDLPEAVAAVYDQRRIGDQRSPLQTLRIHFHVPLFSENSTASELTPEFFNLLRQGGTEHLEIETYTFDILPPPLRSTDVVGHIVREFEWVMARMR